MIVPLVLIGTASWSAVAQYLPGLIAAASSLA